ncbi:MAG: ATP synthase F1 subunit delta [Proteobacteria bacterium]|nr:ATP synthase F1 subunit delta [Pseudomonadota bacterium]
MTKEIKVVSNYASSLLLEATKRSKEDVVFESISKFSQLFGSNLTLREALCSRIITHGNQFAVVKSLSQKLKLDSITLRFLFILIKNARMHLLPDIVTKLGDLLMSSKGIKVIQVVSFEKLNKKEEDFIEKMIKEELKKKIKEEYSVDSSKLEEVEVKYDSYMLDCSVQGALDRIKKVSINK